MGVNALNKWKIGCAALALSLLLGALTGCLGETPVAEVTVVAENRLADKLYYTEYSDGTAVLTGYDGTLTELILPETIDGLPLVGIGNQAFANAPALTTLRCGANITWIGDEAFYGCTALTTVEMDTTVKQIGYYAFEGTPWLSNQTDEFILAGDGVLLKYQGSAAHVVIPDTVKVLSDAFFRNDTMVEVTLGANVERLGGYAFAYCSQLRAVNLNEGLKSIGDSAFAFCDNLRAVTVPDSVTELGPSSFLYCTMLRRVVLGEAVTCIGENAFNYCNHLTSITLNRALTAVGDYAFYECYVLGGVTYAGTSDEWAAITIGVGNSSMTDAALRCLAD